MIHDPDDDDWEEEFDEGDPVGYCECGRPVYHDSDDDICDDCFYQLAADVPSVCIGQPISDTDLPF